MPVLVNDVKWGEDNDISAAPSLSEEEQHAVKQRMAALDKLLETQKVAKYKIEIMFGSKYRSGEAFPGAISLWESGAKLHGGGDTKIYECPGKQLGKNDCTAIIPDAAQGYGHLACPKCKEVWKGDQVTGERLARLTVNGWAHLVYHFFVLLGHNADIYMKRPKIDIRVAAGQEQEKQHMGEKLTAARQLTTVIYPLKNFIKDTQNGADPLIRIKALLSA